MIFDGINNWYFYEKYRVQIWLKFHCCLHRARFPGKKFLAPQQFIATTTATTTQFETTWRPRLGIPDSSRAYDIGEGECSFCRNTLRFNVCKAMRVSWIFLLREPPRTRPVWIGGNFTIYIYTRGTVIMFSTVPELGPKVGVRVKRCISIFAPFMPIIAWNWNRSVENVGVCTITCGEGGVCTMIREGSFIGYSPSARIIFVNRFRFARGILSGRENAFIYKIRVNAIFTRINLRASLLFSFFLSFFVLSSPFFFFSFDSFCSNVYFFGDKLLLFLYRFVFRPCFFGYNKYYRAARSQLNVIILDKISNRFIEDNIN